MLKRWILAVLVILQSSWAWTEEFAVISDVIENGRALTEKVLSKSYTPIKNLRDQKAIRAFIAQNGCREFKYHAYQVGSEEKRKLYLLASRRGSVVKGRHFSAPFNGRHIDVHTLVDGGGSCESLVLSSDNSAPHIRIEYSGTYPTEFHMVQSAIAGAPITVQTENGVYSVTSKAIDPIKLNSLSTSK